MNKQLMIIIVLVSMIPGFVATGRGISGMLVNDTSNMSSNTASGFALYFLGAALLLTIAIIYLVNTYKTDDKNHAKIVAKKTEVKIIRNNHTAAKVAHVSQMSQNNLSDSFKLLFKNISITKMNNDKAEQYIVFVVGLVALVGILVLVLG